LGFALFGACSGGVKIMRFIKRLHGFGGAVDEGDELRESVAEETGDAQCDVDAGAAKGGVGDDLKAGDTAIGAVPLRLDAHEGEGLGDVVPEHRAGPIAVVLQMFFDEQVGGFPAKAHQTGPG